MTTLKTPEELAKELDRLVDEHVDTWWSNSVPTLTKAITQDRQHIAEVLCELLEGELDGLMEKLADVEHVRWAKWQNYLHSHLTWNNELQAWVLPHEWKARWQTQINKPYSMLSEKEKESDREQVRPYLKLIKTKAQALIRQTLDPISNQE